MADDEDEDDVMRRPDRILYLMDTRDIDTDEAWRIVKEWEAKQGEDG